MQWLRPLPDEPAAATAELPAGLQITEAVPPEAQEPGAEKEAPESGALAGEDEAEGQEGPTPRELIAQLAKDDPELAAQLKEDLGIKAPDDQIAEWEGEQQKNYRQTLASNAYQAEQATLGNAQQQLVGYFEAVNQAISEYAQKIADDPTTNAKGIELNAQQAAQYLWPIVEQAAQARGNFISSAGQRLVGDAIEGHQSFRHLSKEERGQVRTLLSQGKWGEAITLGMDAALKAAPEHIKQAAAAEADKKLKAAEAYQKLLERTTSTNGRRKSLTGGGGGGGYGSMAEAEQQYIDGKLTHEEYRKARERFLGKDN